MREPDEERSPKRARTEDTPFEIVTMQAGGEPPRVPWLLVERQAARQAFIMFGVGRWREIHLNFCRLSKAKHVRTAGELERAVWHLLQALRVHAADPGDIAFLDSLLKPVAHLGDLTTAGQPWPKVDKGSRWLMGRLRNLADFNAAVTAMQQQPEVLVRFRQLLAAMPDRSPPATWWNTECDVALLRGMYRAGYGEYDAVFSDPEFLPIFNGAREAQQARLRELALAAGATAPGKAAGGAGSKEPAAEEGGHGLATTADGSGHVKSDDAVGEDTAVAAGRAAPDSGTTVSASDPSVAAGRVDTSPPPSYIWPDGQVLTPRLRRLCDLLLKAVRQVRVDSIAVGSGSVATPDIAAKTPRRSRQSGGAAATGPCGGAGRGMAEKAEVWSKKDRLEALGLLMRFGLPHAVTSVRDAAAVGAQGAVAVGADGIESPGALPGALSMSSPGGVGNASGAHLTAAVESVGELVSLAREHCPRLAAKSATGIQQALRDLLTEKDELLGTEGHEAGAGAASGTRTPRPNRHAPGCGCRICQNIARRNIQQQAGADGSPGQGAMAAPIDTAASVGGGDGEGATGAAEGSDAVAGDEAAVPAGRPGAEPQQQEVEDGAGRTCQVDGRDPHVGAQSRSGTDAAPAGAGGAVSEEDGEEMAASGPDSDGDSAEHSAEEGDSDGETDGVKRHRQDGSPASPGNGGPGGHADGPGAGGGSTAADEEAGPGEGSGRKRRKKGSITKVLTAVSASRLRQRLELLEQLGRGLEELSRPPPVDVAAAGAGGRRSSASHQPPGGDTASRVAWEQSPALVGKRGVLPVWWQPEHDLQLAQGVMRHGFGAWDAIAMDPEYCFASCARAAQAVNGGEDAAAAAGVASPTSTLGPPASWMPSPQLLGKRVAQIVKVMQRLLSNPRSLKTVARRQARRANPPGAVVAAAAAAAMEPSSSAAAAAALSLSAEAAAIAAAAAAEAEAILAAKRQRAGGAKAAIAAISVDGGGDGDDGGEADVDEDANDGDDGGEEQEEEGREEEAEAAPPSPLKPDVTKSRVRVIKVLPPEPSLPPPVVHHQLRGSLSTSSAGARTDSQPPPQPSAAAPGGDHGRTDLSPEELADLAMRMAMEALQRKEGGGGGARSAGKGRHAKAGPAASRPPLAPVPAVVAVAEPTHAPHMPHKRHEPCNAMDDTGDGTDADGGDALPSADVDDEDVPSTGPTRLHNRLAAAAVAQQQQQPSPKRRRVEMANLLPDGHVDLEAVTLPVVVARGRGGSGLTLTLVSLGRVDWQRKGYHNTSTVYPLGYQATREYFSMARSDGTTTYLLEVVDGGESPVFRVTAEDMPGLEITGKSPGLAWNQVLERVRAVRGLQKLSCKSGVEMFGLSHPKVQALILQMPEIGRLQRLHRPLMATRAGLIQSPEQLSAAMAALQAEREKGQASAQGHEAEEHPVEEGDGSGGEAGHYEHQHQRSSWSEGHAGRLLVKREAMDEESQGAAGGQEAVGAGGIGHNDGGGGGGSPAKRRARGLERQRLKEEAAAIAAAIMLGPVAPAAAAPPEGSECAAGSAGEEQMVVHVAARSEEQAAGSVGGLQHPLEGTDQTPSEGRGRRRRPQPQRKKQRQANSWSD
ncbi:hypothetical protein VaNZ11_004693, partial [Volvox africanus]